MKLVDSLNPTTQAENIKRLNAGLEAVDAKTLPGTSTATTGQILKLTGENKTPSWADEYSYTPPAYSTTETSTGQKWTDGKDIYQLGIKGTSAAEVSQQTIATITGGVDNVIKADYLLLTTANNWYKTPNADIYVSTNGNVILDIKNIGATSRPFNAIVFYTKPDPTPGRAPEDSDLEPEEAETKKTRKKTTK